MSAAPPRQGLRSALLLAVVAALLGSVWSSLLAVRGPQPFATGATSPALRGSLFMQFMASRFLGQSAIEGRIVLQPFEPLLWGDEGGRPRRITRLRARVFVCGLTHVDVIADETPETRVVFRLSRNPNVPSEIILQHGSFAAAQQPTSGEWAVEESIVPVDQRGAILQAHYHHGQSTFRDVARLFGGRWFDVELEREGRRVTARVDGHMVGEMRGVDVPPGRWGLEGGDLPYVYLSHLALAGERLTEGRWQPFAEEHDFGSPNAAWADRIFHLILIAVGAAAAIALLATMAWALAPGLPWITWLRRSLWCAVPMLIVSGHLLLSHGVEPETSFSHTLMLGLIGGGAVWWLLLAGAGEHWRFHAQPLENSHLGHALRVNWRALGRVGRCSLAIGAVLTLVWLFAGAFVREKAHESLPLTEHHSVAIPGNGPLRRGDVIRTEERRIEVGDFHLTLEAVERPTTIEVLSNLRYDWPPTGPDTFPHWVALRLSTEPGQSGFLFSDSAAPIQPVDFTLPLNRAVSLTLAKLPDTLSALISGETIGSVSLRGQQPGSFGLVIREGAARVQEASLSTPPASPQPGKVTLGDASAAVPPLIGSMLVILLLGWLLSAWTGVRLREVLPFVAIVGGVSFAMWLGLALWCAFRDQGELGYTGFFPQGAALIVADVGLYLWLAANWSQLRRRLAPVALLVLALPAFIEATLRASPLRWDLTADFQTGYVKETLLLRPQLDKMLWEVYSGELNPRGEQVRRADRADHRLRVLCLGGSSTYGSGVASDEATWPAALGRRLRERGESVEVLNFGFPALTAFDDLELLRLLLVDLRPDWVVLSLSGNDAIAARGNPPSQRAQWEAFEALTPAQRRLRRLLLSSELLVGLNRWVRLAFESYPAQFATPQNPPEDFRWVLERICDLGEEHTFRVVFVAEPQWERVVFTASRHEPWIEQMREVAAARGALFIDPTSAFRDHLADDMWATWIHPTEIGNQLMAETLAPTLAAALASAEGVTTR
jgi:lysophospholipase L1-like esterase